MTFSEGLREVGTFFKNAGRGLILYDFWNKKDISSSVYMVSSVVVNIFRSTAATLAPVFLSTGIQAVASKTDTSSNDPVDLFKKQLGGLTPTQLLLTWGGLLAVEKMFQVGNGIFSSLLQTRLSDRLIGEEFLKKIHSLSFEYIEKNLDPQHTPSDIMRLTEETSALVNISIDEFAPLLLNLTFSIIILSEELPTAAGIIAGYAVLNTTLNLLLSLLQRNVNEETQKKANHFTSVLSEDLRNMETIRVYRHEHIHSEHEKQLFKMITEKIIENDLKPSIFKLVPIKFLYLGAIMGTIGYYAKDSIQPHELDDLIIVINYLMIMHNSSEAFGRNLLSASNIVKSIDFIQRHNKSKEIEKPEEEYDSKIYKEKINPESKDDIESVALMPPTNIGLPLTVRAGQPIVEFNEVCYEIGYDLCLMLDEIKPEPGKLYIREKNGKLAYTVITPEGEIVNDSFIEALPIPQPFTLENLNPLRSDIFKITSQAGHTHESANKKILSNVSFKLFPEKSYAFVGKSGSGKSTIIKLLCGLRKKTSGRITVFGEDIDNISPRALRSRLTLINQQTQLFKSMEIPSSKLKFNVLYGHSDDAVLEGLREKDTLSLNDEDVFEEKLAAALIAPLEQKITAPSGGEQQRIGIARGYRETPLMILDEPTSAQDSITEFMLINKFNKFITESNLTNKKDSVQTLIVTAHRLRTVKKCDEIFVIEDGRVKEHGSHLVLKAVRDGLYQRYYKTQTTGASSFGFFTQEEKAEDESDDDLSDKKSNDYKRR